jgi:hypothetical protein
MGERRRKEENEGERRRKVRWRERRSGGKARLCVCVCVCVCVCNLRATQNHRAMIAAMVPKGIAATDLAPQRNRLIRKNMPKQNPG